jgi:hypothetical protein
MWEIHTKNAGDVGGKYNVTQLLNSFLHRTRDTVRVANSDRLRRKTEEKRIILRWILGKQDCEYSSRGLVQ